MIIASNNKGKIKEIKEIFNDMEVKSLKEVGIDIEVEEDADTFYGNALKKAKTIYSIAHEPVIADDSGLCIAAYNNWPGVLTHRFLGDEASDEERNETILARMNGVENRSASVICSIVYYDGCKIIEGKGILEGKITESIRGSNGFGFDSIFELTTGKTLAELEPDEKNLISARYLALIDLKKKL